jgi:ribosome biogenesis SPOUT family RNA methylase Rps3
MKWVQGSSSKLYIVEHLDPELGPWSALEYLAISNETKDAGAVFCLSSVSKHLKLPQEFQDGNDLLLEERGVEDWFETDKSRICLLDPAATTELSPDDGSLFDAFLFGGILGTRLLHIQGLSGRMD